MGNGEGRAQLCNETRVFSSVWATTELWNMDLCKIANACGVIQRGSRQ